ncbi:MAG: radical SAM protein [candidate division KSB1 bacterium]|nr:radical SAM protein [candidate division KSB1 bacterium]MDZ7357545.1 radical SAM protein [candidate division KSB1 bacterium]
MGYRYIFGPVPSRRLGRSLGVDLVPHKTCTLNCIYCECGKTTHMTLERAEYVPTNEVIAELTKYLSQGPMLDFVTFSGAGEPTLHSGLGQIIIFLKQQFPQYKIALLTNGTLFFQPALRQEVANIDLILPSLDAADDQTMRRINRPHRLITASKLISGLVELKKIQTGLMWLEVFIVPGINDHPDHIEKLKEAIHQIKPDLVQLNSLDRPGTEHWVSSASLEQLQDIAERLDWPIEIIAKFPMKKETPVYREDVAAAILEMIQRRPGTAEDLSQMLGLHITEVNKYLGQLIEMGVVHTRQMERGVFYWAKAQ